MPDPEGWLSGAEAEHRRLMEGPPPRASRLIRVALVVAAVVMVTMVTAGVFVTFPAVARRLDGVRPAKYWNGRRPIPADTPLGRPCPICGAAE